MLRLLSFASPRPAVEGPDHVEGVRALPGLTQTPAETRRLPLVGAKALLAMAKRLPIFRPTFDRHLPHRLAQDVIQTRLLPMLTAIVHTGALRRVERADGLSTQFDELLARARALGEIAGDPVALFVGVEDVTKRLEHLLGDVDYITLGHVGLVAQLSAVATTLRTSQLLWKSVRAGYAFRDPQLRSEGLRILARSEAALGKANQGIDVTRDLLELESELTSLTSSLQEVTGDDLGLANAKVFQAARRAWGYRQRVEEEILERDGRPGPLTNRELIDDVRNNGVPLRIISEELDAYVLPVIRRLIADARAERGPLVEGVRARSSRIEAEVKALMGAGDLHLDVLETRIIAIQREVSLLLQDLEKLTKPVDGIVRQCRSANDAMIGLKGMFVGFRAIEALEDPTLMGQVKNLTTDAKRLLTREVTSADLPMALADFEERFTALDAELTARLHIARIPAIEELRRTLEVVRRVVRLRMATREALNPAIHRAVRAAQDLSLTPEQRGPIFDAAMQDPLLQSTVGLAVALRELDLGFTFAEVGGGLDRMLHAGGGNQISAMVASSPLAFLAKARFEKALGRFDSFVENVDTPEGHAFVDRSLNVFRAVYEVERDQLAKFAAVVPEDERVRVATSISEYLLRTGMILVEWISDQLANPSGEAVADFLEMMIDTSAVKLDELGSDFELTKSKLDGVGVDLRDAARRNVHSAGVRQLGNLGTHFSDGPGGPYAERLRAARRRLEEVLEVVEAKPDAKIALGHVLADLGASAKMAVNLVQLFGAASNSLMNDAERERVIQTSVERMGPMFIKVMQSLVNMESLIRASAPDSIGPESDPIMRSLAKLQDQVTPLPWHRIEERVRSSLGLTSEEPLVDTDGHRGRFVSIDKVSLKSGSIGQLHRAKIRIDRDGEEQIVDCVVKVLRPGVEEAFENTIRATRLTLSLVGELLRLDKEGDIFGSVKADLESRLPLIARALNGFIESFRVETDFAHEVENLRAFERMFRGDPHVFVPEVFDSHTANGVLTMQELKGFKLSNWTERYAHAAALPKLAEALGPVSADEAGVRAVLWAEQTLGMTSVTAELLDRGRRYVDVRVSGVDLGGQPLSESIRIRTRSGKITPTGQSGGPSQQAAENKAKAFAERAFGLGVERVQSFVVDGGFRCRVELSDPLQKSAEVFVGSPSGEVSSLTPVPDLGHRGAEALRDRLRTTFMVQLVRGMLHGDPHEGNFFVMPDGESIGLIDFGLALDVGLLDAKGPLALLTGAVMKSSDRMAEAMLDLSTAGELEGDARTQAKRPLVEFFAEQHAEVDAQTPKRSKGRGLFSGLKRRWDVALGVVGRSLKAIHSAGLVPRPRVIHSLKAMLAMGGNISKLEPFDEREPSVLRNLSLMARSWATAAIAPFVGERTIEAKRRRLAQITQVETPPFVVARAPPKEAPRRVVGAHPPYR